MTATPDNAAVTAVDPMRVQLDVEIEMDDGLVLRADVFRPAGEEAVPVILSAGPYGKWVHFEDGQPFQWERMSHDHPDTVAGTSNRYASWEIVDPEKWVPDGYAVVRVDSRGAGRSPGVMDLFSARETRDLCTCIEWAGTQPWSNGRVGLAGISYYAIMAWKAASLAPAHLSAVCAWEGAADLYRDWAFHGGMWNGFNDVWFPNRVVPRQHGRPSPGPRCRFNGESATGPQLLADDELSANLSDYRTAMLAHPLIDSYWEQMNPDLSAIDVPLLSAGNWGGAGLHLRGNVEGFLAAGSRQKWLELHGLEHWTHFYTDYGVALQKQFFGHFLRDEDNGWSDRPRVVAHLRRVDGSFQERAASSWPLPETRWEEHHLRLGDLSLRPEPPCEAAAAGADAGAAESVSYEAMGRGLTFLGEPLARELTVAGPAALKLFVSSDTDDADLFVVVRAFAGDLQEVTFQAANNPHAPLGLGWLRASHRELDPGRSTERRPVHAHRREQPLTPGEVYELSVEIWPFSAILPAGYRLGLSVLGRDYRWPGAEDGPATMHGIGATANPTLSGVGPFVHVHPANRPAARYANTVTLHADAERRPRLVLGVLPSR